MKKKILTLLALLCLTVSGAWAQNPSGSCGANLSWEFDSSNGTLTITGTGAMDDFDYAEHQVPWLDFTITSVIIPDGVTRIGNIAFYACTGLTSIEIPGSVTSIGDEAFSYCSLASVTVNATTPPTLGTDAFAGTAGGLKIYVPAGSVDTYKAAWAAYEDKIVAIPPKPGEVTWNAATKTGTFAMPGYDVELEVAYFNITAPTANTTDGDIHAGTATPLINAASTTEEGATIKYLVTATSERPTSTDGFSADVPTAEAITAPGTYYVWYYLDFATGDDSDISAQAIEVTVADYLDYTVIMANGTEDAGKWTITPPDATDPEKGVKPGTEIKATYSGTKRVKSVKAVKKAAAAPATGHPLSASAVGEIVCSDGLAYAAADKDNLPQGVTAVAMVAYKSETAGSSLALALTDEGQKMNWWDATDACSVKNASTPVTGATWLLASKEQWQKMGAIDDSQTYNDLRDGFTSVGGSNLQSGYYWSSTDYGPSDAWRYDFGSGSWSYDDQSNDGGPRVRACLAW